MQKNKLLKIVVTENQSLAGAPLPDFEFPHEYEIYEETQPHQIKERLQEADIAFINKSKLKGELLDRLPRLKIIAITATGTDNVDLAVAKQKGIHVQNVAGYSVHSVPEHTFGLMLNLCKNMYHYIREVKDGNWTNPAQFTLNHLPISDLNGKNLGIIGHGSLGATVGKIAKVFGMNVNYLKRPNPKPGFQYLDKDELIQTSDFLTLHCPLTPETRNLIARHDFDRMKSGAFLINTARGGVVNEEDLVDALQNQKIAGAGFDVSQSEPLAPDSPLRKILDHPRFLLTPHNAWSSREAITLLLKKLQNSVENLVKTF